jgi:phosphoglucosamine mutase
MPGPYTPATMRRRYFGTDGVRGIFGEDLTEDLVRRLGRAFAAWSDGCPVLVGRDTRASGAALELALSSGLAAGGSPVRWGGILPTPAVPLLADGCGAVISASHNPPEYNGVKFFDREGFKLSDADEAAIEELLDEPGADAPVEERWPEPEQLGDRYVELVTARFGVPLAGLRVVCDCANGAMSDVAPAAFARLGADVIAIGDDPDGTNINVGGGAGALGLVSKTTIAAGADFGVAFDGDGDRMLAVDAAGREVDGDQIVAILALHLGVDLVAVTRMTNLGFHRLMDERGVRVVTTDVGDRYVLAALRREGGRLGGEQSGHIVYLDGHTTGDGLVAALLLARAVRSAGLPLGDLAAVLRPYPQARCDVPVREKTMTETIESEVARANAVLDGAGRVLVRPSGTEPVVRVLAEAENGEEAEEVCSRISAVVATELG